MRVLFVSSGNSKFGISPIVKNQGESLKNNGIDIEYFTIKGKVFKGYPGSIPKLKKYLKSHKFDLVHAHYSLSAFVATLAGAETIIVSLMGSDIQAGWPWKSIIRFFHKSRWKATILKSERMRKTIGISDAFIIPNGVDFQKFKFIEKNIACNKVNFNKKKHLIFVCNPNKRVKNFKLAAKAYGLLNSEDIELNVVSGMGYELIPYYMYAADVLILTSLSEGSPNVIKEAMACNLPIVSTDVGDVKEIITNTDGCYIASYNPKDVAEKIKKALNFGKRTTGRDNIQHLEINTIAKRIIKIYEQVINAK